MKTISVPELICAIFCLFARTRIAGENQREESPKLRWESSERNRLASLRLGSALASLLGWASATAWLT